MSTHKKKKDLSIGDKCRIRKPDVAKGIPVINCEGLKNNSLCTVVRMCGTNVRVKIRSGKRPHMVHIDYLRKVQE